MEKRLRLLVVDDMADTADSMATLLRLDGHDVEVSYGGTTALLTARTFAPHAVLLDVGMPGMNGFQLAERLRQEPGLADTVLIGITGYATEVYRLRGHEAGFAHYLLKPVDPDQLSGLLSELARTLGLEGKTPGEAVPPMSEPDQRAYLAVRPPPRAPAAAAGFAPLDQAGVLVVDDDPGVRAVLNAMLQTQGCRVWLAAGGREALDLYCHRRDAINMVVLDVRMSDLDGPQTLAALRELDPQVRCCFLSGDFGEYTEGQLWEAGAVAVLAKPPRLDEVVRVVRDLAVPTGADDPKQ